jgi:hypothetical protein
MRFRKLAAMMPVLLSLVVTAPAMAQEAAAPAVPDTTATKPARVEAQPRTGWMFGLGLGYAMGRVKSGSLEQENEASGTFHLRVGTAAGPSTLVGIEYLSWGSNPTDTTSSDVLVIGPSVTWFWRENFYVRGVVGWGSVKADLVAGAPPAPFHVDDDGFAYLAAAGWERRWGRRLAIAPEAAYAGVMAGEGTFADIWAASLQFNFYY